MRPIVAEGQKRIPIVINLVEVNNAPLTEPCDPVEGSVTAVDRQASVPRNVVMDSRGRHCVPLAPRTNGAFVIESGAVAQASVSKRQALVRGGI